MKQSSKSNVVKYAATLSNGKLDTMFGFINTHKLTDDQYRRALMIGVQCLIMTETIKLADIKAETEG